MANKSAKAKKQYAEKQKRIQKLKARAKYYDIAIIALGAAAILFFFLDWAQVYNTDHGVEVSVSGFSFAIAALTGQFSSTAAIFGDLAVPFYFYAQDYCSVLGALSLAALLVAVATVALHALHLVFPEKRLVAIDLALDIALAVLLAACFVVGLAMNGSEILPKYCSGNPACSINTYAIVAAIAAIALTVCEVILTANHFEAQ